MPVNSDYEKGSQKNYSPQKILMLSDYSSGFTKIKHLSVKHTLTEALLWVKYSLFHCILTTPIAYSRQLNKDAILSLTKSLLCGSIWMQEIPISNIKEDILMDVKTAHNIHLSILQLYFITQSPRLCHQHGIGFSYDKLKNEYYCGVRLPWTFITHGNTLALHIVITKFKAYSLQLHYFSFHPSWISLKSKVVTIYNNYFLSLDVSMYFYKVNTNEFYVMSHKQEFLEIFVRLVSIKTIHMRIHDGPGSLSNAILEINNSQITTNQLIETSAYWAFIHIVILDFNRGSSFVLDITASHNRKRVEACRNEREIAAKSNKFKNTVCMDRVVYPNRNMLLILSIDAFLFSGPNMATDLSDSVCQYGGLLVQFYGHNQYEFCEPLQNYDVYTGLNAFVYILIWFSGYSRGTFEANLNPSDCKVYYPEFGVLELKDAPVFACSIYYAQGPHLQGQNHSLQLGPPALGSARLSITQVQTLDACEPAVSNLISGSDLKITIQTESFEKWPLHTIRRETESRIYKITHDFADDVVKNVDYLNFVVVSLPYICTHNLTRVKLGLALTVSKCFDDHMGNLRILSVNRILNLDNECLGTTLNFKPTGMGIYNFNTFLFLDNGYVNSGHEITVRYVKCPLECRNYRYNTFVISEDSKTVYEYTADVGQSTSTGHYHRGYKVSILVPDKLCSQHISCTLELYFWKILIRNKDRAHDHYPTLHFHGRR